jgi:hypothetical protein
MAHRLFVLAMLAALMAASAGVTHAERPALAIAIGPFDMVAPGQVAIDVTVSGLQRDLHPTIEGTITVADTVIEGPRSPVVAAHLPGALDLRTGTYRLGGVAILHFPPMPPLAQNTPIGAVVTVRQGSVAVTARRAGMLLLPTVVVPGYLNDLDTKPDADAIAVLEQRGYRVRGASPTVFWFAYPSRRFPLEEGAKALAAYVRRSVLPSSYAARINVVGYSEGGLLARWDLAFDPDWAHLVNQFMMVGVPNQGVAASYVYAWYPALARIAATPGARDMFPTYPFWHTTPDVAWSLPPDAQNAALTRLNAQPLPVGVRVYAFYGSTTATWAGLTGQLPNVAYAYGPGDGVVLASSVLGLPIYGGGGVPGLADRIIKVDLRDARHLSLMRAALPKIADLLAGEGVNAAGRR